MSSSTLYLLPAHEPQQPNTLLIRGAFYGASAAIAPTNLTVDAATTAGVFYDVDSSAAAATATYTLPAAPGNQDRIVFLVRSVSTTFATSIVSGATQALSTGGLTLVLTNDDEGQFLTFTYNAASSIWVVNRS